MMMSEYIHPLTTVLPCWLYDRRIISTRPPLRVGRPLASTRALPTWRAASRGRSLRLCLSVGGQGAAALCVRAPTWSPRNH